MRSRMRFCVLSSGSSGNACYVETQSGKVLVDAGLTCQELVRRLRSIGVRAQDLDAVLITHEHIDHIRGAGPLARRYDLPVYLNGKTLRKGLKTLGNLCQPVLIQTGQAFTIHGLCIETFTKCHDAADPLGFVLSFDGVRIGLATDLGRSTRLVEDYLRSCTALVIEFNHDLGMLERGPYPPEVKRRIRGQEGHLSNHQGGHLLGAVAHQELNVVVLAHLSEANNAPERAYQEAEHALYRAGTHNAKILLSQGNAPSPLIGL